MGTVTQDVRSVSMLYQNLLDEKDDLERFDRENSFAYRRVRRKCAIVGRFDRVGLAWSNESERERRLAWLDRQIRRAK